jgi:hypothetical protein
VLGPEGVEDTRIEPGVNLRYEQQGRRHTANPQPTLDWQRFAEGFRTIEENVERVVQGKRPEIRLALAALVAEGTS